MNTQQLKAEVIVNKDATIAWNAYTRPEHITQWNFATDDWQCPSAENDLRVGGKYKARMEAKDGSFGFDFEAVYDEVRTNDYMAYTLGDGRKCSVKFLPEANSTKVEVLFEAESQNPAEFQQKGWQMILDNYKRHVDAL